MYVYLSEYRVISLPDAKSWEIQHDGGLIIFDSKGVVLAVFAPGVWHYWMYSKSSKG